MYQCFTFIIYAILKYDHGTSALILLSELPAAYCLYFCKLTYKFFHQGSFWSFSCFVIRTYNIPTNSSVDRPSVFSASWSSLNYWNPWCPLSEDAWSTVTAMSDEMQSLLYSPSTSKELWLDLRSLQMNATLCILSLCCIAFSYFQIASSLQ